MNPLVSNPGWRLTLAVCAILAVGIIGYTAWSVLSAMREPDRPRAAPPAAGLTAPTPDAEAPEPPPANARLPDAPAAAKASAPAVTSRGIAAEFEADRQREQGRKELIERLRKQALENPDDPGTLSKERIDKLEKSGDSLM